MTRGEIAYDGTVWPVEGSVAARQYICPFGFSPSALEDRFAALCTARSYGQLASLNAPEAVIALVDRKEAVPLNWT